MDQYSRRDFLELSFKAGAATTVAGISTPYTGRILPEDYAATLAASSGASAIGFIQSGARATPRTVQDKLRDSISVKDFGAIGNGTRDDTAAIQAAINAAIAGNCSLYFPVGSYLVTSQLNYTSPAGTGHAMKIFGETCGRSPSGSIIKWGGASGGTMFYAKYANSFVLEDLYFFGNFSAGTLCWFDNPDGANGSSDIKLNRCKFAFASRKMKSTGVLFGTHPGGYQVSEVYIQGCLIEWCYYGTRHFSANVKNFVVRDGGIANCFWGICHGDPGHSQLSLSGHFIVDGVNFSNSGHVSGGAWDGIDGNIDVGADIWAADGNIRGCESEGSARFVSNGRRGSTGNNDAVLNLLGNHFETSTNVPSDDYIVIAAGGLILNGNHFENARTVGAVAKVQSASLAYRVGPNWNGLSLPIISMGNWYQNASTYAPIYDGGGKLATDPLSDGAVNRYAVMTFGDFGGPSGGTLCSLEDCIGTGSATMARLTRQNATDCNWQYSGLLSVGVNKVTIPYTATAFHGAAPTVRETVYTIPAQTKITNVVADLTVPFAGTGLTGTITMMLGDATSTENEYVLSFDVKTGAVTKGIADADLGAKLARATAVQGGTYYWKAGNLVRARFDSGVGNFGTGTVTNLTRGSVDIYITVERMP